jgi:hypothetical protein
MIAIFSGLGCCCFTTCLWCCWESLKLAIDVVDAAADFVMCTKRILLVPFLYFLLSLVIIIVWFIGYVNVLGLNDVKGDCVGICGPVFQVKSITWKDDKLFMAFIMWFGLIWSLIIIDYTKNWIILYASSSYYFNSPTDELDGDGNVVLDEDG